MNTWFPGLCTVPEGHVAILERYGKYVRTLRPGLNVINPFTETIKDLSEWNGRATKFNRLIETTEQLWEIKTRGDVNIIDCFTKDHISVKAGVTIHFKLDDDAHGAVYDINRVVHAVKKAVYVVDIFPNSLNDICSKALRAQIGKVAFNDIFSKRKEISDGIVKEIGLKVKRWGVKLLGVEVGNLEFDPTLTTMMQKRRLAEEEQSKAKIEAETNRFVAENEAYITTVRAKAEADEVKINNDASVDYVNKLTVRLGSKGAVQLLTAEKVADAFSSIAESPNTKTIMIPSEFKGMLKLVQEKTA